MNDLISVIVPVYNVENYLRNNGKIMDNIMLKIILLNVLVQLLTKHIRTLKLLLLMMVLKILQLKN